MKKLAGLMTAATAILLPLAGANAEPEGFYAAARAGLNWSDDERFDGPFDAIDDKDNLGWIAGGALGYDFKPLRLEFEFLHRNNDVDGLNVITDGGVGSALGLGPLSGAQSLTSGSDVGVSTLMTNLLFDIPVKSGPRPFIGGGLGWAFMNFNHALTGAGDLIPGSESQFAIQGIAGVAFDITPRLAAEASYRYLVTDETAFRVADAVDARAKYKAHSVLFGIRYTFGGSTDAAKPARTPAPAAPPPNQGPRAVNDSARVEAGQSVTIDVLANDSDPDGRLAGVATFDQGGKGRVETAAGGGLMYRADSESRGRDSFSYTIQDDDGAVATARVTLDILPPQVGPFLVFFDWDKASLRDDARAILEDAAAAYSEFGFARIRVVGHTDTSGPSDYNDRLSERRAAAVAEALEGLGVDASDIVQRAEGEASPLVPTDDGVREPQNRRVEITFPESEGRS